ncbi:hypothetical protein N3K66_004386 [Trichothecium roseum]|uniref:Uncharacterized protein n=1 Tax=Trichothecium roseum TaxID=47278 RepID=A0ACC0V2K9_9HYPO|nr:hypothetical protein N3K66_004386 [Trichothecium roseum]
MSSTPDSSHRRPTSAPISEQAPVSSVNMVRSSSTETNKVSKRKGTRSVSTLTPAQLARKRANDREAQRAIRARTKEHIERLEAELDELRRQQDRDETVRELLRRNKLLEKELRRLRESMPPSITSSPYSAPVYDDTLSNASGVIPSPRSSPFPSGDFGAGALPDYAPSYMPFPSNCETWAATVHTSIPSTVSSPSSSANTDDYTAYMPTSAPNSMLPSPSTAGLSAPDVDFEDSNDARFRYNTGSVRGHDGNRRSHNGASPMGPMPTTMGHIQQPPTHHYPHHPSSYNIHPALFPPAQPSVY